VGEKDEVRELEQSGVHLGLVRIDVEARARDPAGRQRLDQRLLVDQSRRGRR
jgi:hypothetical protein